MFDDPTGKFSASKFWTAVAYATATYVVILNAHDISWELFLVYIATVGGSEIAKKYLVMRYGEKPLEPRTTSRRPQPSAGLDDVDPRI